MAEALRSPPRGFETLVVEHLWRKKWHILDVIASWLRESKKPGGVQGHFRGACGVGVSLNYQLQCCLDCLQARRRN